MSQGHRYLGRRSSIAKPGSKPRPATLREWLEDGDMTVRRSDLPDVLPMFIALDRLMCREKHWYWRAFYVMRGFWQRARRYLNRRLGPRELADGKGGAESQDVRDATTPRLAK